MIPITHEKPDKAWWLLVTLTLRRKRQGIPGSPRFRKTLPWAGEMSQWENLLA